MNVGGAQRIEISGNNSVGVFFVNEGNLTINNLTVRNGSHPVGGGIHNLGTLRWSNQLSETLQATVAVF